MFNRKKNPIKISFLVQSFFENKNFALKVQKSVYKPMYAAIRAEAKVGSTRNMTINVAHDYGSVLWRFADSLILVEVIHVGI